MKIPIIVGASSALHDGKVVLIANEEVVKNMTQLGINVIYLTNGTPVSEIQLLKTLNNTNVINVTV